MRAVRHVGHKGVCGCWCLFKIVGMEVTQLGVGFCSDAFLLHQRMLQQLLVAVTAPSHGLRTRSLGVAGWV